MPAEDETITPTNFIRNIIHNDLDSGKHNSIQTRFPPEPNGYLHIGHAKSICLNFGIAEDFNGKCNLRFDDTNPEKEDDEYVKVIKEDVRWLGFEWSRLCHASDYFEQLYNYAIEMIKQGKAYVDSLSAEQIREYRGSLTEAGRESPDRNRSIEEILSYSGKCVLVNSKTANIYCVQKLIWPHQISICVIRLYIALNAPTTNVPGMNGRFIPCMITLIASLMRLKTSPTPCVHWNLKTTARYMTGC